MAKRTSILAAIAVVAWAAGAGGSVVAQTSSVPQKPVITEAQLPKTQHWFGVAVENIPAPIAKQLKLKPGQGMMVVSVLPGSPAEQAKLKAEDLLVEINGEPLMSQQDLAHAANLFEAKRDGTAGPKASKLTYLREGDRHEVRIMPQPRPGNMIVMGAGAQSFEPRLNPDAPVRGQLQVKNYALPNGVAAQVGPGYRIDINNPDPAALSVKSIRSLVNKGQTVVLTQETDAAGATRNLITVGGQTHEVDPARLDKLPEDLRPLAEQMLKAPQRSARDGAAGAVGGEKPLSDRVQELEAQNRALQAQLQEMIDLLKKEQK